MSHARFWVVDATTTLPLSDPAAWMTEFNESDPIYKVTDRGYQRGDGIFEAISVVGGHCHALQHHLERFAKSAAMLDLPGASVELWRAACEYAASQVASDNEQYIKFMLSRGLEDVTEDFHGFTADSKPTAVLYIADAHDFTAARTEGIKTCLLETGRDYQAAQRAPWMLLGAKTLSYAVNMAMQREAKKRGVDDTIMVSSDGYLLEGPSASLVLLKDGVYITPDTSTGILVGTSQRSLFTVLEKDGATTEERLVTIDEIYDADAAWLVSSLRMAAPITEVDGKGIKVDHAVTDHINTLLLARTE